VCDPRAKAPTKDVMQIDSPCLLNSPYEIWQTQGIVRHGDREVYRAFATPAVFDPITVFDPTTPSALVFAWSSSMTASMRYPESDWSGHRGCDRESYAQPGYWNNADGEERYYTDAMGEEVAADDPRALEQIVSASHSVGAPATWDGLAAFKIRRNYCGLRDQLGVKN
jgi:hypothetical protein